jgi:radical SAM-linked protein
LRREYQRGLAGKCTHPCEKPPAGTGADGKLVCYSCGLACDLEAIAGRRADGARQLQNLAPPVAHSIPIPAVGGGNHSLRYRLCYGKTGWSRYLSHLEVVRLWQRAFRRAGIILQHSAGFHPHPKLSFGPALPVGVEGLAEYLDCHTVEYAVPEHMRRALTNALPDTFPLHDLREISRNTPGIEQLIDLHLYEIIGPASSGGLASLIKEKIAAETWIITRKKEQTVRKLDARPYIVSVEEKLADGYSRVELKLKCIAGGTVKPGELLEALYGEIPAGTRIVRVRLGREIDGKFVTPLDEACLTVNG